MDVNERTLFEDVLFDTEASKTPTDDPISKAVLESAECLASGLSYRLQHLAEREKRVKQNAAWDTLPNMPARLIWEALDPGSAAFFVVYKLMHEARSVLPKIYRAIAWQLCSVQPERFNLVTYREQLWDILAAADGWPDDVEAFTDGPTDALLDKIRADILGALAQRGATDWWSYRAEDRERDASWIAERFKNHWNLVHSFATLRRVQLCEQSALTAGNVIMQIPRELQTLAETIASQGREGELPTLKEIGERVAVLASHFIDREDWGVCNNISVPFDLLTLEEDQQLRIIAMTRSKASQPEREELRRRMIYLRFFAHYAFGERKPDDVVVVTAFYADKVKYHDFWLPKQKPLFNWEELWSFDEFWDYVAGKAGGGKLVEKVTEEASSILRSQDLITKLREFVAGANKAKAQK